ncbi:hypothetical protein FOA52_007267, partial [Chlamydomonas sp. UWO 241]
MIGSPKALRAASTAAVRSSISSGSCASPRVPFACEHLAARIVDSVRSGDVATTEAALEELLDMLEGRGDGTGAVGRGGARAAQLLLMLEDAGGGLLHALSRVVAGTLGGTPLLSVGIWRGLDKPLAALGGMLSGGGTIGSSGGGPGGLPLRSMALRALHALAAAAPRDGAAAVCAAAGGATLGLLQ